MQKKKNSVTSMQKLVIKNQLTVWWLCAVTAKAVPSDIPETDKSCMNIHVYRTQTHSTVQHGTVHKW